MSTAKRKLAAIVFADIAGYTDQASQDEKAALSVRDRVERLVKASTIGHNGRIVKTMGDGAMMEFASAVEAVSCALDIQDQMDHLNSELDLAQPIAVRVGVHVGDVVEEENDLYGNAVNIASRVHGMAKPGGICITREVYVQIRPILKLQCMPVAGASSDRLPEKVEVFAVLGEEAAAEPGTAPKRKAHPLVLAASLLCIAVIAFALYITSRVPGGRPEAASHRLLLPDWVTPGEWFTLDAGSRSPNLAVYFGNRQAESKFEGGRLHVQTPPDLPTEQTTIAVFEGTGEEPLLRQPTQVIRYGSLAMNSDRSTAEPLGERTPSVKIDSIPIATERKREEPAKTEPGGKGARPNAGAKPSDEAPVSPKLMAQIPPLSSLEEYDDLVDSICPETGERGQFVFKHLERLPATVSGAMRAVNLANAGKMDEAKKEIQTVRVSMRGQADDPMSTEAESILKTAEAIMMEKAGPPAAPGARRAGHPKFAEAFAFSINRGTSNVPGLIYVGKQIDEKKLEEARRALDLLKKRPDLTEAEKKAIVRLEKRIQAIPPAPAAPG